jgi:hypothetical protein
MSPTKKDIDASGWFQDLQQLRRALHQSGSFLGGSWLLAQILEMIGGDVRWNARECGVDLFMPGAPPNPLQILLDPGALIEYLLTEGYELTVTVNRGDDFKVRVTILLRI